MRAPLMVFGCLGILALFACHPDPATSDALDSDQDGLSDRQEHDRGTDAMNADTDGDGERDGEEVANGDDPLVSDHEEMHETPPEETPPEETPPEETPPEETPPADNVCWGDGECTTSHASCEAGEAPACERFQHHCTETCVPREENPPEDPPPPPPPDNACWGDGECATNHASCEAGEAPACERFQNHCTETCTPHEEPPPPPPPDNACWGEGDCAALHATCEAGGHDACEQFTRHCSETCGT